MRASTLFNIVAVVTGIAAGISLATGLHDHRPLWLVTSAMQVVTAAMYFLAGHVRQRREAVETVEVDMFGGPYRTNAEPAPFPQAATAKEMRRVARETNRRLDELAEMRAEESMPTVLDIIRNQALRGDLCCWVDLKGTEDLPRVAACLKKKLKRAGFKVHFNEHLERLDVRLERRWSL